MKHPTKIVLVALLALSILAGGGMCGKVVPSVLLGHFTVIIEGPEGPIVPWYSRFWTSLNGLLAPVQIPFAAFLAGFLVCTYLSKLKRGSETRRKESDVGIANILSAGGHHGRVPSNGDQNCLVALT